MGCQREVSDDETAARAQPSPHTQRPLCSLTHTALTPLSFFFLSRAAPFIASANKEQKAVDRLFDAKIQPFNAGPGHCVTGLYPPTNWATDTWETNGKVHPVVRARHPPDCEINLDHVYGYNGGCAYTIVGKNQQIDPISSVVSPNLFYT